MKVASSKEMQAIDARAIKEYGVPSILLMEHAAYSVFMEIKNKFPKQDKNILIVCGPGNNGGDGFALARQLTIWTNYKIKVIILTDVGRLSLDGKLYYEICKNIGIECVFVNEAIALEKWVEWAGIIVDALFGTGLKREILGIFRECISYINRSSAYVISVDIPSGVDSANGCVLGQAVKADLTITFELPKLGMCIYPGVDYVGEMKIAKIGIPECIIEQAPIDIYCVEENYIKDKLPTRPTRSNKGTYGKVLVIGGSRGLSGAITLSATGCIKIGAGLVTAAVPSCIHDIMEQKLTEVMTIPLPSEDGKVNKKAQEVIKDILPDYTVVAFGPGIGRGSAVTDILKTVLETEIPCVIDADGLYALKPILNLLQQRKSPTIITPHPGEMSRLTNKTIEDILNDSLETARMFSNQYGVITVLKTERTIMASPHGAVYINTTGNPGLAKGGSGDVLTGFITGLLAQKVKPIEAVAMGVYLHGMAGDIMAEKKGIYTMLPSDLYEGLEDALKEIKGC